MGKHCQISTNYKRRTGLTTGTKDTQILKFLGDDNRFYYNITTFDTYGSISSQYFGENFNAIKMETNFYYSIKIYPPNDVVNNTNFTLHIEIDRVLLMNNLNDNMKILSKWGAFTILDTNGKSTWGFCPPGIIGGRNLSIVNDYREIIIERKITSDDANDLLYNRMPGFNISWYYTKTTAGTTVSGKGFFKDETNGREFNRYVVCIIPSYDCTNLFF